MKEDLGVQKCIQVQMFGQLKLTADNDYLDENRIHSARVCKLLVYFILHRGRAVTVSELCDALWGEDESDNPVGALKNLVYRLRMSFKKVWEKTEFILTSRGTYQWNPMIELQIDTEEFEDLKRAGDISDDNNKQISNYYKACEFYKGDFVMAFAEEYWVSMQASYYRSLFLTMAKSLALLLKNEGRFEEMYSICKKAIEIDELDEDLRIYQIESLIDMGKQDSALECYKAAVKMLYEKLGVSPSPELESLYNLLLKEVNVPEPDINIIQRKLFNESSETGAFICEYGMFKRIYSLEHRRIKRLGRSIHLMLVTVENTEAVHADKYLSMMNKVMDIMEDTLISSLRTGDVISKYSVSQYIVMLLVCDYESTKIVTDRVERKFYSQTKKIPARITFSLNEMKL